MKDVIQTLAELQRDGYRVSDRMRLRFRFQAPRLRAAVELADALRMGRHNSVQIRPAARRFLSSRRWDVIVTTPPAPVMRAVIELWAEQLDGAAEPYEGCTMVGWEPIVGRGPAA
jgi:hypothetical protein